MLPRLGTSMLRPTAGQQNRCKLSRLLKLRAITLKLKLPNTIRLKSMFITKILRSAIGGLSSFLELCQHGGSMSCCKGWKSCSRLLCSAAKKLTILKLKNREWESEFFNLFSADCLLF